MQTQAERLEIIRQMFQDPELTLTPKEIIRFAYHAMRYELALHKIRVGRRQSKKYADLLNDDVDVFALRKSMRNL